MVVLETIFKILLSQNTVMPAISWQPNFIRIISFSSSKLQYTFVFFQAEDPRIPLNSVQEKLQLSKLIVAQVEKFQVDISSVMSGSFYMRSKLFKIYYSASILCVSHFQSRIAIHSNCEDRCQFTPIRIIHVYLTCQRNK